MTETNENISVPRTKGFQAGHPRFGGRRKGSRNVRTATAREVAAKLRVDPLEWLLRAAQEGQLQNADGTYTSITPAERLQAMRNVMPYLYPKRSTVHVSGQIDSDVQHQHQHVDLSYIMRDPALAAAAENLALAMVEQEARDTGVIDAKPGQWMES